MTNSTQPSDRTSDNGRIVIILALLASVVLLSAILFLLVSISRNGLHLDLGGNITLGELGDRITVELKIDEPITVGLDQPVQMFASGPNGDPIPVTLGTASCPTCGGSMLPSKWNIWDGRIEWICPVCGDTAASRVP